MREQLHRRLDELKKEFAAGQARATELDKQQSTLQQTLLRISGAIQVLEEELASDMQGKASELGNVTKNDLSQAKSFPSAVRV